MWDQLKWGLIIWGLGFPIFSWATPQEPDLLIIDLDTILIFEYPLEYLMDRDAEIAQRIKNEDCIVTDCWREHIATWQIQNDSLFLIQLRDCCDHKIIPLKRIFDLHQIRSNQVFASWFTTRNVEGIRKSALKEKTGEIDPRENLGLNFKNGLLVSKP